MVLRKAALEAINTPRASLCIAMAVDRSQQRIMSLIKQNPKNSILTTAAALKVIQQETGLSQEEILTEDVDLVESAKVIHD